MPLHFPRKKGFKALSRQMLLARIGVLKAEIASRMAVYRAMETRVQASRVNREGEESSAEVGSLARVPGGPITPVEKFIYIQGIMGGDATWRLRKSPAAHGLRIARARLQPRAWKPFNTSIATPAPWKPKRSMAKAFCDGPTAIHWGRSRSIFSSSARFSPLGMGGA